MLFGQQLIMYFLLLTLATLALAEQDEISKVVARLESLEGEINSNRELIMQLVQMQLNLTATLTRVDARTEDILNRIQCPQSQLYDSKISNEAQHKELVPESILANPKARLFTGEKETGNSEYYDFQYPTFPGGCYRVKNHGGKIKSVDTMGKCVRLFSGNTCHQWSQAFYPGSPTELDSKLRGVYSIGPCVDNEFDFVKKGNTSSSNFTVKNVESSNNSYEGVPDLVGDKHTRRGFTSVSSITNPITEYLLGDGYRLESVKGEFRNRHITTPEQAENTRTIAEVQGFYEFISINNNTDEVGFAFPLELGGPVDKIYNIFPQDKNQAEKFRRLLVVPIKQLLLNNSNENVGLSLDFFYENSTSLRPTGIWYRNEYRDGSGHNVRYGYFPN